MKSDLSINGWNITLDHFVNKYKQNDGLLSFNEHFDSS